MAADRMVKENEKTPGNNFAAPVRGEGGIHDAEQPRAARRAPRRRALRSGDAMSATVAIVAGGGGPLGHATAVALATDGLTVVAVDRNEHALRELPDGVRREVADQLYLRPAAGEVG